MGQRALQGGAGEPVLLGDGAAPACQILGADRLSREGRLVGLHRERPVHLGRALAERLGQGGILGEGHAGFLVLAGPLDRLLLEEALQPVDGEVPAVALIGHQPEGDAERGLFAALGDPLHRSEVSRGIGKARHLGEKAGHLDLRLHAGLQAAIELQDQLLVDDRGGVALLHADAAQARGLGSRQLIEAV
jgi:hypothetical protein